MPSAPTPTRRNRYALLASFLAAVLWVAALLPAAAACKDGDRLTLLHFNDFHGQLEPYTDADGKSGVGGIARLARAVEMIRGEDPGRPVLLLFAGDLLQGTVTSSLFLGIPDLAMFERMGVDAAAVGNHEFDYGQDIFRRLGQRARFPFLTANVQTQPEPLPVKPYVILSRPGGPRVAVLGLTTPELTTATHPKNVNGVSVEEPVTVTQRLLPGLREQADMVVVLSHMGISDDRRLARDAPDIELIVGGHNHLVFEQPVMEGDVAIVQAGERGRWLGRMDLACKSGRMARSGYQLLSMDAGAAEQAEIAAEVKRVAAEAERELGREVGRLDQELDGRREVLRRGEAAFGNFVADLARQITGADVALFNGGGFRATLPAGPLTLKHIYQAFPFRNELVVGSLTGAQIAEALAHSAGLDPAENPGGFLQVSGLRYAIAGGKLESAELTARPINPAERYKVVMPDFLAAGGDGYAMFKDMENKVMTGRLISDMVIEAFRDAQPAIPKVEGRIVRR
jgi:2',3'-cyclic-nucleotide 2'-phosphodiesterase (5'-nucleotidase family)